MPAVLRAKVHLRFLLAGALVVFASVTCSDGSLTGPRTRAVLARLGFAPAFSKAATEIFESLATFGFEVNNVHVHLTHANGQAAMDTTISIAPGQDSVVIEMAVKLETSAELLKAVVELRDDNIVLFSGTQVIAARAGGTSAAPPLITVDYVGPGATATTLTVAPKDTAIIVGESISFRPLAKDKDGNAVANLALSWLVKDAVRGTVDVNGLFKASLDGGRGSTYVIARMLSGLKDSAHINVVLPLTKVVVVSGNEQTGTVGKALPQAIVVETQASDNLPVPFVPLSFRVTSGGGSVSRATASTDANGRATVSLTLGSATGTNSIEVRAENAGGGAIAPVLVSASANADAAHHLRFVQPPPQSVGVATLMPIVVELLDQYNNRVTSGVGSTANVMLLISGGALGAVLGPDAAARTKAAVGGIATFEVSVDRAGTGYVLSASTDLALPAISSDPFEATDPAVFTIIPTQGDGVGLLKGEDVTLQARVVNAAGSNIPNTPITFTIVSGGGTLTDGATSSPPTTTNSDGSVSVDWHVGTSGVQLVRATTSTSTVDFHAFIAETLVVVQQPSATVASGSTLVQQPSVQLQDKLHNAVRRAGVLIDVFGVTDPAGQLTPEGQPVSLQLGGTRGMTTDASGIATFTDVAVTGNVQTLALEFAQGGDVTPVFDNGKSNALTLTAGAPIALVSADNSLMSFFTSEGDSDVHVKVTDGFNGVGNVNVTFAMLTAGCTFGTSNTPNSNSAGVATVTVHHLGGYSSCAISSHLTTAPSCQQECFPSFVTNRVFVAPAGTYIWVGDDNSSIDWTNGKNWYYGQASIGSPPDATRTAFVPIGALVFPEITGTVEAQSVISDGGAISMARPEAILNVYGNLDMQGAIAGPGTVWVSPRGDVKDGQLRATVEGTLRIGPTDANCSEPTPYTLIGPTSVGQFDLRCKLEMAKQLMIVQGNLQVLDAGWLSMLQGEAGIIVRGDATFNGNATLRAGVLDVSGNFSHTGNCETFKFDADSAHVTVLDGDATKDTLRLTWDSGCGSRFGALEILAAGEFGVSLTTNLTFPPSLPVNSLVIGKGSKLNVPALFIINVDSITGRLTLVDDQSLLRLESLTSVPGLGCSPKPLAQGDNTGPMSCAFTP